MNSLEEIKQKLQCVVARYQEDVSWVRNFPAPAVVYDKSGSEGVPPELALPNIGREAHTYLTHIVRQYPHFSDFTLFTQANPFPHLALGAGPGELFAMVLEIVRRGAPFKGLAYYTLKCDHLGRPHDMRAPESEGKWAGYGRDIPVGQVYSTLFSGPTPEKYHARGAAGLFIVRKDRILSRPAGFYQRALELVTADPQDRHNTGHAFERLWSVIFNGNTTINKAEYP